MPRTSAVVWPLVRAERQALVDDLSRLDGPGWDTPSLCAGWSVHDAAAHLVDNARTTTLRLAVAMARARFDFDRQNDDGVRRERGATPAQTLARLRAVVDRRTGPPAPLASRLVEEVLHGEDVRRPLGLVHAYAPEAVLLSLRHQLATSVALGGGRQRAAGVRLVATDTEVSVGAGPEVSGPALSLLLAVSGRGAALDDLAGPGLARVEAALHEGSDRPD